MTLQTIIDEGLAEILAGQDKMVELIWNWANINSGTYHLNGLNSMLIELKSSFAKIGWPLKEIDLPDEEIYNINGKIEGKVETRKLGKGLFIQKKTGARQSIYLGIHYDTVYDKDHSFQKVTRLNKNRIQGPGVADAKGGLVILLKSIKAFEKTPLAKNLDWEIFLNPDEEIGSPGSAFFLEECAERNDLGLIFEPCLEDGNLIGSRGGSGFFTLIVKGKAAHVGRDFLRGRNSILMLSKVIVALEEFSKKHQGLILNVGKISGGNSANMVAELAGCKINIRISEKESPNKIITEIRELIGYFNEMEGYNISIKGNFHCPPKPMTEKNYQMLLQIKKCAARLGLAINWQPSFGVCDGNKLQHQGLPVIDTMGAQGGGLHSSYEYLELESLVKRSQLTFAFLMKLAAGEFQLE